MAGNPLLTVLGRRGRGAVIHALLDQPQQAWTIRGLAHQAAVQPTIASRTIKELNATAAVDVLRPGRDAQVRFLPDSPAGQALAALRAVAPDLRARAAAAFASALPAHLGARLVRWQSDAETHADPAAPTRLALIGDDEDDLLDAVGPALDAVREAGLPEPEVTTWTTNVIDADPHDPVAAAVRAGRDVARPAT